MIINHMILRIVKIFDMTVVNEGRRLPEYQLSCISIEINSYPLSSLPVADDTGLSSNGPFSVNTATQTMFNQAISLNPQSLV